MTIQLSKELEQIVHDAMLSGLYPREDDVIYEALMRLNQSNPPTAKAHSKKAQSAAKVEQKPTPVSPDELNRRLFAAGLITQLPDPSQDVDDDDEPPIEIEGEPLSETIIRERG